MSRKRTFNDWTSMTAEELAEATKEFDRAETTPPTVKPPAKEAAKVKRFLRNLKRTTPARKKGAA